MPKSLTNHAIFIAAVTTPLGVEARNAASLETSVQQLTDRTYYVQQLCEVSGVTRIAEVADLAALADLDPAPYSTGEKRFVPGYGVYRLLNGTSGTSSPWYIEGNGGGCRWEHEAMSLKGLASGIATLTAGGRCAQLPPYATIDVQATFDLLGYSNATTSYTTVCSHNHTAAVGDLVVIDWHAAFSTVGSGGSWSEIFITDGGVETAVGATLHKYGAIREAHSGSYKYTVVNAGTITVRLKAKSDTSGTTASDAATTVCPSVKSMVIRP